MEGVLGDAVKQALVRDLPSEAARRACLLNSLLAHHAALDAALVPGATLLASSLPPELSSLERQVSVHGGCVTIVEGAGPCARPEHRRPRGNTGAGAAQSTTTSSASGHRARVVNTSRAPQTVSW